jgi:hypothetical protein
MISPVTYVLRFLLGDSPACREAASLVGYTDDRSLFHRYKVIIHPSGFFDAGNYGTPHSLPSVPLKSLEGTPLLYGSPEVSAQDGRLIVKADLVASAYFLLSRYEEYVRRDVRDSHGRFPGKQSLPAQAGFIHRPVVDEYGCLLRKWLRAVGIDLPEPENKLNCIYFTVDLDIPFLYRRWKGALRGLLSSADRLVALKTYFTDRQYDPAYTFPWIAAQNDKAVGLPCRSIYFFKSGGRTSEDKPRYNLFTKDMQALFSFCREREIQVGLHASYFAGSHPQAIRDEKTRLEEAFRSAVTCNRHHFLSCREPEDFRFLLENGITDDFTMGYADVAGFRLGTCRAVSWINPADRTVYPLTLHPLTVMDCTLDREEYMHLSFDEAVACCFGLIRQTERFHGDLTLLWHNHYLIPAQGNWQKELYGLLTDKIAEAIREYAAIPTEQMH